MQSERNDDQLFDLIPNELLLHIFSFVTDPRDLLLLSLVSRTFHKNAHDESLWLMQLKHTVQFQLYPNKLLKNEEAYSHAFFRVVVRKKKHSFILLRQHDGYLEYDPIAYINQDPQAVMNRVKYGKTIWHDLADAMMSSRCHSGFALPSVGLGPKFILEIDLPYEKVKECVDKNEESALLAHIIKIYPGWDVQQKSNAKPMLVISEEGRLIRVGDVKEAWSLPQKNTC